MLRVCVLNLSTSSVPSFVKRRNKRSCVQHELAGWPTLILFVIMLFSTPIAIQSRMRSEFIHFSSLKPSFSWVCPTNVKEVEDFYNVFVRFHLTKGHQDVSHTVTLIVLVFSTWRKLSVCLFKEVLSKLTQSRRSAYLCEHSNWDIISSGQALSLMKWLAFLLSCET